MVILLALIAAASLAGAAYLAAASWAVLRFVHRPRAVAGPGEPVTILKPLHGEDAELYDNLRSFARQLYPVFQIVFGVREPTDPAIDIVRRLIADHPDGDFALVVEPRVSGTNFKVSNLENMLAAAKHPILVIADSDMRVDRDYLAAVTGPLADPQTGLVTCLYRGRPADARWSRLGAMFVNHGFLPSALVGEWLRPGDACFGATMALRRSTLDAIGGFAPLRDQLADDYALGSAVRRSGARVVLSPHLVDTIVAEPTLGALFRHELRWARTIRLLAPAGYAASFVTHPVALAALGVALSLFSPAMLAIFGLVLACRIATVWVDDRALGLPATAPWLVPVRDLLSFAVFVGSFLGNSIAWRDRRFRLEADGRLVTNGESST
jgi:ceramide glucosyltransferase